ncbi:MAG: M3 family metallopeptidase [Steroidobacteraceae bacterium]
MTFLSRITPIIMSISLSSSLAAAPAAPQPLLSPWSGPYGGVPAFDRVRVEDFVPALRAAMQENLAEIRRITDDPAPATFENTMVPLELAGEAYGRVFALYHVWSGTMNTGDFPAVQAQLEPEIAAFNDRILQDAALFARVRSLYESPSRQRLGAEQQRLLWVHYERFVRAGAKLEQAGKERVAAINQRLAALYTGFNQNLLADEQGHTLYLTAEDQLAGLPDSLRSSMAQAATESGHHGAWAVVNTRSAVEPFLTYSSRRELRERAWRTFYSRGDNGDAHDNKGIITQILALRGERARLLGFATHAHWRLDDAMARTPDSALSLMMQVWPRATQRVREEVADMQAIADRDSPRITIEPWDYRYYAEKVRKARYDLDLGLVKPYLQLDKLREAMFYVAGRLYGLEFAPATQVPVAHPDIRVWEVRDARGAHVGLWYFDPYARPGKRSGAWMSEYRAQRQLGSPVTAIVSNNSNFIKGRPGEPVLLSWDDAVTLFHEFGHALHGLNSQVVFPTLAGTSTVRDFVEFPSQLNENWLKVPEVLSRFAVHYRTGEPLPAALLERIQAAAKFNQGFMTVEYLASALVDMKLHLSTQDHIDPAAFERETLADLGMPAQMAMRHRLPQFGHLFSSDDYAGGYYSYLWSAVLDNDAWEAFTEGQGPFDPAVAKRLKDAIMSVGNTLDPAQAYRNFRGRDPRIEALLRARGFASAEQ